MMNYNQRIESPGVDARDLVTLSRPIRSQPDATVLSRCSVRAIAHKAPALRRKLGDTVRRSLKQ